MTSFKKFLIGLGESKHNDELIIEAKNSNIATKELSDSSMTNLNLYDLPYNSPNFSEIKKIVLLEKNDKIFCDESQKCLLRRDNRLGTVLVWMTYDAKIPEYVSWIGDAAFAGMEPRKSITIPGNVRNFNLASLAYCQIDKVIFEDGVLGFTNEVTEHYFGTPKELIIPRSLTDLGDYALTHFASKMKIDPNNLFYGVVDGLLVNKIEKTIIASVKHTSENIAYEGTKIGNKAFIKFKNKKVKRLVFPSSYVEVGSSAFRSAVLDEVVFEGNITKLDFRAFLKTKVQRVLALNSDINVIGKGDSIPLLLNGFFTKYAANPEVITEKLKIQYLEFIKNNLNECGKHLLAIPGFCKFISNGEKIDKHILDVLIKNKNIDNYPEAKIVILNAIQNKNSNSNVKNENFGFDELISKNLLDDPDFLNNYSYVIKKNVVTIKSSDLKNGILHFPLVDEQYTIKYKRGTIFKDGNFDSVYLDANVAFGYEFYFSNCKTINLYVSDNIDCFKFNGLIKCVNLYIGKNTNIKDVPDIFSNFYEYIYVDPENPYIYTSSDHKNLLSKDNRTLVVKDFYTLPDSVHILGTNLYDLNISDLVNLHDKIHYVGKGINIELNNCNELIIPDNIISIEDSCRMFSPIKKVNRLYIGKNCKKLPSYLFEYYDFENITIDEENQYFYIKTIGEKKYLFDKQTDAMIFPLIYEKAIIIPEEVKVLDLTKFEFVHSQPVYIPSTVEKIVFDLNPDLSYPVLIFEDDRNIAISKCVNPVIPNSENYFVYGVKEKFNDFKLNQKSDRFICVINNKYKHIALEHSKGKIDFTNDKDCADLDKIYSLYFQLWFDIKEIRLPVSFTSIYFSTMNRYWGKTKILGLTINVAGSKEDCEKSGLIYYLKDLADQGVIINYEQ